MSHLPGKRHPVFQALLLGVLAAWLGQTFAHGQAPPQRLDRTELGSPELTRLAADLHTQLTLTYQHNRPEYHRRAASLEKTYAAWAASSRNQADRDALRRWLRRAIRASMPGASRRLPAPPVFTSPAAPRPIAKPRPEKPREDQADKPLIDRRTAERLWAESPAAAPIVWGDRAPSDQGRMGDEKIVQRLQGLDQQGQGKPSSASAEHAFVVSESPATDLTDQATAGQGAKEKPTTRPTVAAKPAAADGRKEPKAASAKPKRLSRKSLANALAPIDLSAPPDLVGSTAPLSNGNGLLPLPEEASPLELDPASLPFDAMPFASVGEAPQLIAANALTSEASRVTTRKPSEPFDVDRLRTRVEEYNTRLAKLRKTIASEAAPTAFQINLWRAELENLGRKRQLATLYLAGLARQGYDGHARFSSPQMVFAILRQRIASRKSGLAVLPAQAVRRELNTLKRIEDRLPEIESAHEDGDGA